MNGAIKVHDDKEFTENLASKNARPIRIISQQISIDLWYDRHYIIERNLHVDEDGNKRDIPPNEVEALIIKSLKHLIFYGSTLRNFTFLNSAENSGSIKRIVIKDSSNDKPLSIAVQVHFKNLDKYEFTVITAIDGDLRMSHGQYLLEFIEGNASQLKKFDGTFSIEGYCED